MPNGDSARFRMLSLATAMGVAVFLIVIILLHLAQPEYDAVTQFMSELAFGRSGAMLVAAFSGLFLATAATAANLRAHGAPLWLSILVGVAALSFLGAGLVTLAAAAYVHVLFVALAFVLCGISMCLLPLIVAVFSSGACRVASWGSGVTMVAATGLGGGVLPSGIAQRLSAAALLFWLLLVAWRLRTSSREHAGGM